MYEGLDGDNKKLNVMTIQCIMPFCNYDRQSITFMRGSVDRHALGLGRLSVGRTVPKVDRL